MKINMIDFKTVLDILNKEIGHGFDVFYRYMPNQEGWTFRGCRTSKRKMMVYDKKIGTLAIELERYVPENGGTVLYNENELYRQIRSLKLMNLL